METPEESRVRIRGRIVATIFGSVLLLATLADGYNDTLRFIDADKLLIAGTSLITLGATGLGKK